MMPFANEPALTVANVFLGVLLSCLGVP